MSIDVSTLSTFISVALATIGALAFLVSVITEMIKEIGFLNKIPTALVVIIVAQIMTLSTYFGAIGFFSRQLLWYELIADVIVGFIVAFIAQYGWERTVELWNRFKR